MDLLLIFVFVAITGILLFQRTLRERGKRFVRAYHFLKKLESGFDVESANSSSHGILNTKSDMVDHHDIIMEANRHIATYYGGKQLPLINLAVSKGFRDNAKVSTNVAQTDDDLVINQWTQQRIYNAAGEYHEKFVEPRIDTIDDVEFSAAALGALDGTIQAFGLRSKFSDVEMMGMGSAIIARQLTQFDRVDILDTDRIADLTFEAMNSEAHNEIIGNASLAAYTMHKQQSQ